MLFFFSMGICLQNTTVRSEKSAKLTVMAKHTLAGVCVSSVENVGVIVLF